MVGYIWFPRNLWICILYYISENKNFKNDLLLFPNNSSIFTTELQAILVGLQHVYHSKKKSLLVLSDSLSSLQALHNMKYDHPFLIKVHKLYSDLDWDGKEIVFIWVPGHIGISGNSAADSAAKDALDEDVSDKCIPFSDLKPPLNSYITELWQNEWNSYPLNKTHKFSPKINKFLTSYCSNQREEMVLSRLHIGHSYMTHSFLLKEEDPPFWIWCNELLSLEHM